LAIVLTGVRAVASSRVGPAAPAAALVAVAVVLGGLALPRHNQHVGPSADDVTIPTARRLVAGLGALDGKGPFLFDQAGLRFAEPYSVPVLAGLQARGIEFRVDDPGWIHQLGPSRALAGGERIAGRLFLREGDAAFAPQPGRLVSRVAGLDASHHAEMLRLHDVLSAHVAERGLRLTERGRDLVSVRGLPGWADAGPEVRDLDAVDDFDLPMVVRDGAVDIEPAWLGRFRRYASLREAWTTRTVALFVEPS
jgi:hypothetical protein